MNHSYTDRWVLYCRDTNTPLNAGCHHNSRFMHWVRRVQLEVLRDHGLSSRHEVTDEMIADHLAVGAAA